jgi:hypothetical protein
VSLHAVSASSQFVLASSQFVLALEQVVAPSIEVAVALRHVCGVPLDLILRLMQLDLKAMPVVVAMRRNVGATARERFVSLGGITSGAAFRFPSRELELRFKRARIARHTEGDLCEVALYRVLYCTETPGLTPGATNMPPLRGC